MAAAPDADVDPLREELTKAIGFQYRIERLLGRGGMGAVYLAHELALDRDVAIKVLPPEQAHAPQVRERFRREARTAARLSHPNIVPLYTFGEVSGLVYFVMGYVGGESLAARLARQGALQSEEARAILVAMCDALVYAHRQGIIHRDIKPDNILIDAETGSPLLTDFGIAKPALTEAQLTTTGQLIGTPHYMSPEQALGRADLDARSDVYSLGVVGYEMVCGRRPFEAESPLDALSQRLTRDPKPIGSAAADVAPDLAAAIHRCLQRDPAARWSDARALREALQPSEEEAEYSPPVRVLQTMSTVVLPVVIVATVHLGILDTFNSDVQLVGRLRRVLAGMATALILVWIVTVLRLKRQGLDLKSIALKAFQQPTWSRAWYPRFLRRRGDVWDRLPRSLRLFRTVKGLLLTFMFAVFVPFQFMPIWDHQPPALLPLLWACALGGIALMFALRRRAVGDMHARAGLTPVQGSALLNTPTWRISTWRRSPNSTVLSGQAAPPPSAAPAPDAGMTQLADRVAERPTQLG